MKKVRQMNSGLKEKTRKSSSCRMMAKLSRLINSLICYKVTVKIIKWVLKSVLSYQISFKTSRLIQMQLYCRKNRQWL